VHLNPRFKLFNLRAKRVYRFFTLGSSSFLTQRYVAHSSSFDLSISVNHIAIWASIYNYQYWHHHKKHLRIFLTSALQLALWIKERHLFWTKNSLEPVKSNSHFEHGYNFTYALFALIGLENSLDSKNVIAGCHIDFLEVNYTFCALEMK